MSGAVSLPNHTFTGQAQSSKQLTIIVHILSPETGNCLSLISEKERMTIQNTEIYLFLLIVLTLKYSDRHTGHHENLPI